MFDTTGMLCRCGKRLVHKGIENGCHILKCPSAKCEGQYQIPVDNPKDLEFPGERILMGWKPRAMAPEQEIKIDRKYACKDCKKEIDIEQAEITFNELDRALCGPCAIVERG